MNLYSSKVSFISFKSNIVTDEVIDFNVQDPELNETKPCSLIREARVELRDALGEYGYKSL